LPRKCNAEFLSADGVVLKQTVLFVVLDLYADWEAAYLSSAVLNLGQGKYAVKTISLTKEPIHSLGGFTLLPDYDLQSVPEDFAGLILIGGDFWRDAAARQTEPLVKRALAENKVLGGICAASAFLGAIGALNTVRHTSNDLDYMKQWAGNSYTGEQNYLQQQAVRDGNVVTANGTAALEFAKEVLEALQLAPESEIERWYNFYKLGFYRFAEADSCTIA